MDNLLDIWRCLGISPYFPKPPKALPFRNAPGTPGPWLLGDCVGFRPGETAQVQKGRALQAPWRSASAWSFFWVFGHPGSSVHRTGARKGPSSQQNKQHQTKEKAPTPETRLSSIRVTCPGSKGLLTQHLCRLTPASAKFSGSTESTLKDASLGDFNLPYGRWLFCFV